VSVARGIEGRPWAAARAGAWLGSFGTTAASRRAIEDRAGAAAAMGWNEQARREGRSTGRAEEAPMAGSGRSDGTGSRSVASCSTMAEAEEQSEGREERERERKKEREGEV